MYPAEKLTFLPHFDDFSKKWRGRQSRLRWKGFKVGDLFECSLCRSPFVAVDANLIAQRNGYCAKCTKSEFLKSMGLPADFLDRLPGNP